MTGRPRLDGVARARTRVGKGEKNIGGKTTANGTGERKPINFSQLLMALLLFSYQIDFRVFLVDSFVVCSSLSLLALFVISDIGPHFSSSFS